jgi:hypothetical protein
MKSNEILTKLYSMNTTEPTGIDIKNSSVSSSSELNVYDHL